MYSWHYEKDYDRFTLEFNKDDGARTQRRSWVKTTMSRAIDAHMRETGGPIEKRRGSGLANIASLAASHLAPSGALAREILETFRKVGILGLSDLRIRLFRTPDLVYQEDSFANVATELGVAESIEKAKKLFRLLDREKMGELPLLNVVGAIEAADQAEQEVT